MSTRDIVVIGGSAGGVEAVLHIARALPQEFNASVFVTIHIPATSASALPGLLSRAARRPAVHPRHDDPIVPGTIYVAPPDRHLIVRPERVGVVVGPRENGHRPAIDPLFRSAARAYGPRVIGVVLSGNLDDGTAGLRAIWAAGGTTVVQEPTDALYAGMPANAIRGDHAKHVVPLADLASCIVGLSHEEVPDRRVPMRAKGNGEGVRDQDEVELAPEPSEEVSQAGLASGFTCPECHGALWELDESGLPRFRCRVGHAFTFETLLSEQRTALEAALWAALRALEETAELHRRLVARAAKRHNTKAVERYSEQVALLEKRAEVIRQVLDIDQPVPLE